MNKFFVKIFTAAGVLSSLVACNQKADFVTESFVAFGASSVTVSEDAGTLEIPVYAYTKDGDLAFPRGESANTTVTFEVIPGTAVEGENYTVEPANGVLTFSGTSEQKIVVKVVDHDGVVNDAANFTIRLTSASSGYDLGGLREMLVSIQDADNPLAYLYGTYAASGVVDLWGESYDLELVISAVDGSTTEVTIAGLSPYASSVIDLASVKGAVSGSILSLSAEQVIGSYNGVDVFFSPIATYSSQGFSWGEALIFNIDSEKNTLTAPLFGYAIAMQGDEPNSFSFTDAFFLENVVFTKKQ